MECNTRRFDGRNQSELEQQKSSMYHLKNLEKDYPMALNSETLVDTITIKKTQKQSKSIKNSENCPKAPNISLNLTIN